MQWKSINQDRTQEVLKKHKKITYIKSFTPHQTLCHRYYDLGSFKIKGEKKLHEKIMKNKDGELKFSGKVAFTAKSNKCEKKSHSNISKCVHYKGIRIKNVPTVEQ